MALVATLAETLITIFEIDANSLAMFPNFFNFETLSSLSRILPSTLALMSQGY